MGTFTRSCKSGQRETSLSAMHGRVIFISSTLEDSASHVHAHMHTMKVSSCVNTGNLEIRTDHLLTMCCGENRADTIHRSPCAHLLFCFPLLKPLPFSSFFAPNHILDHVRVICSQFYLICIVFLSLKTLFSPSPIGMISLI